MSKKRESKYIVVADFKDLKDGNHVYIKGDKYPRENSENKPTAARIKELASIKNKMKKVLIKEQD